MKTVFVALSIFLLIGCFPLTREVVRVGIEKKYDVKSAALDTKNHFLVITTVNEIAISGVRLPNPMILRCPDSDGPMHFNVGLPDILNSNSNNISTEMTTLQPINHVSLNASGFRNTRNPLRWLCTPFTATGDILLGIFTLGHVNGLLSAMDAQWEQTTSDLEIKTSVN